MSYDGTGFLLGRAVPLPLKNASLTFFQHKMTTNFLTLSVIVYGDELSRIKPTMYTRFFIACDVISLSLQGGGGGVASSSTTSSTLSLGNNIMLAGLVFQIVTLAIFSLVCLDFATQVYRFPSKKNPTYDHLRSSVRFHGFLGAVLVTFLTIFTRCVYRVVELGGGWNNSLQREEIPFIILESVYAAPHAEKPYSLLTCHCLQYDCDLCFRFCRLSSRLRLPKGFQHPSLPTSG
jgi:RTA1 like protein